MQLRPGHCDEAGMSAERIHHAAQSAERWVEEGITPALVILVARRGVVVLHEAFGRLTPDPGAPPLRPDTIFPLASLSKPITATAAMLLVEDGMLGLNRPVGEYIPEFVGSGKDTVLVHHLLTHTSGLRDEDLDVHALRNGSSPLFLLGSVSPAPFAEYLRVRYDAPLWKPPGMEMSYCTYNYDLLGEIVARVSGQTLEYVVRTRICEPLGMVDTHFVVPDRLRPRIVRRPAAAPYAGLLDSAAWLNEPYASAGAFGTALDMAAFGQMFLGRGRYGEVHILSPAAVTEMTRNQIPGIHAWHAGEYFPEAEWGFGWEVHGMKKPVRDGSLQSPLTFAHHGAGGMLLWVDPVYEIVGAYFSVVLRELPPYDNPDWCADLFTNMVTAAVLDG